MDGVLTGKPPDVAIEVEKLLNAGDTMGSGNALSPAARAGASVPIAALMRPLDSVNVSESDGAVAATGVITGFEAMAALTALRLLKRLPVTILEASIMPVA